MTTISDIWSGESALPFDEPPSNATELEIADYLEELAANDNQDALDFVNGYCVESGRVGQPGFSVQRVRDHIEQNRSKRWLEIYGGVDVRREDIPPPCPIVVNSINVITKQVYAQTKECDRWRCPDCGAKRANRHLRRAHIEFHRKERIWFGSLPNSRTDLDRLRQRRYRLGAGVGYVSINRRDQSKVYVFSTVALSRRSKYPPKQGVWLSAQKAMEVLRFVLRIPGVKGVKWGGSWTLPKDSHVGDDLGVSGQWAHIAIGDPVLVKQATDEAIESLENESGIRVVDLTPEQVKTVLVPKIQSCLEILKRGLDQSPSPATESSEGSS